MQATDTCKWGSGAVEYLIMKPIVVSSNFYWRQIATEWGTEHMRPHIIQPLRAQQLITQCSTAAQNAGSHQPVCLIPLAIVQLAASARVTTIQILLRYPHSYLP
jgi:hypothetical protein